MPCFDSNGRPVLESAICVELDLKEGDNMSQAPGLVSAETFPAVNPSRKVFEVARHQILRMRGLCAFEKHVGSGQTRKPVAGRTQKSSSRIARSVPAMVSSVR